MNKLASPHRYATTHDARAMAELVDIAGEGLPTYLWSQLATPGQSPLQVGESRAQRESGSFSYQNTILREQDGQIVAAMVSYPLPDEPETVNYADMPAMFVPLQQLEDLAPGTWYINVLATYPEYRGHGYGSELLELAEQLANASGCKGLSIIVSDGNAGARRLYERNGYAVRASRAMVKESWQNPGENWVLLTKSSAQSANVKTTQAS